MILASLSSEEALALRSIANGGELWRHRFGQAFAAMLHHREAVEQLPVDLIAGLALQGFIRPVEHIRASIRYELTPAGWEWAGQRAAS